MSRWLAYGLVMIGLIGSIVNAGDFSLKEIDGASSEVVEAAKSVTENGELQQVDKAFAALRRAAAGGDHMASLVLGYCHEFGRGTPRSLPLAQSSYLAAANAGSVAGMRRYGRVLRTGASPNFAAAREWLSKADEAGDSGAKLELARMDLAGEGIARPDPDKARFLMKMVAEAGSLDAMIELGRGEKLGLFGEKPNHEEAKRWIERAAKENNAVATLELGFLYEEGKGVHADADRALFYYRSAAQQDLPQAQYHLGMCALKGVGGEKDEKAAVEWFRKAAELDSTLAMFQLARIYENGAPGIAQDFSKSNDLYLKAAELGNLRSQNQLGIKYRDGRGVKTDHQKALKWFSSAASQRFPPAMINLGLVYEQGHETVPQDYAVAARLYTEAAKQGDAIGQFLLARLFESGNGVAKDPIAAFVLAVESARLGHKQAATLSAKLKKQLTPEQLKTAESRLGRKIP